MTKKAIKKVLCHRNIVNTESCRVAWAVGYSIYLFFLWSPEAYPQGMLARGRIPCVRKIAFRRSFQLLIFLPTGKLVSFLSFVDAAPQEFLKYQPQSPFPLSILKKASLGEIKPSNHCLASQCINTS